MKRATWMNILILLVTLVALVVVVISCGDDDDDDDDSESSDGSCTVNKVCQYIFDHCSGANFTSIAQCESTWLDSCTNIDAYLPCACNCLENATGCEVIQTGCENDCWNSYCM